MKKMKKINTIFFGLTLSLSSLYGSVYCTQNSEIVQNPVSLSEVISSSSALNDSTKLSKGLLLNSQEILALSNSLISAGEVANVEYVEAMLALSDDILEMADKIGEMADRILVMADDIGDMADRIIETQEIQNENIALTQSNILEAQKNFNQILNK
jgi:hypothetical protein